MLIELLNSIEINEFFLFFTEQKLKFNQFSFFKIMLNFILILAF